MLHLLRQATVQVNYLLAGGSGDVVMTENVHKRDTRRVAVLQICLGASADDTSRADETYIHIPTI